MLSIVPSNRFRRDLKQAIQGGRDVSAVERVVDLLAAGKVLDKRYKDRPLTGDYGGFRECRIAPDWVLVYQIKERELILVMLRAGKRNSRRCPVKKQNVFLKSTLRQPVRTVCLFLLIGVLAFAFVARALEYLLVRQEISEISGYYRAIASVQNLDGSPSGNISDEASAYLEANPYVEMANHHSWTSGVLQDGNYNYAFGSSIFSPTYDLTDPERSEGLQDFSNETFFAYGTYTSKTGSRNMYRFRIDSVVSGYPEFVEPGKDIILVGDSAADQGDAFLQNGQRYFFCGYFDHGDPRCVNYYTIFVLERLSVREGGPWFIEAPTDLDLTLPEYQGIARQIRQTHDNACALALGAMTDVSAAPDLQESNREYYLTAGRWPDAQDNAEKRPVIAIHAGLAEMRGYQLGDIIPIQLRNVDGSGWGYLGCGWQYDSIEAYYEERATETAELEVVGIYGVRSQDNNPYGPYGIDFSYAYIPISVLPETFVPQCPGDGNARSVVLTSPEQEAAFVTETKDDLAAMGYRVVFLESGYENFRAAASGILAASGNNLLIFGGILLAALCLAGFVYFRFRRRDIAISRGLGVPAGRCIPAAALPLILLGGLGSAAGAVLAWRYTAAHAGELLGSLAEYGGTGAAALPTAWLVLLCACLIILVAAVALLFSLIQCRRPPLALLQGGVRRRQAKQPPAEQTEPAWAPGQVSAAQGATFRPSEGVARKRHTLGIAPMLRFTFRHIRRAPFRSLLCLVLAGAFMAGLMIIRVSAVHSEAELERLYSTVTVDMEIVKTQAAMNTYTGENGFIRHRTVERLMETGHVIHRYVEGDVSTEVAFRLDGSTGRRVDADRFGVVGLALVGVEYPEEYLSRWGIGGEIAYREGYDGSAFLRPWDSGAEQPVYGVVIAQSLYEEFEMETGDMLEVRVKNADGESVRTDLTIIGTHPGQAADLLMPLETLRNVPGVRLFYNQAVLTLDPAINRQLEEFKAQVNDILMGGGTVPLTSLFWDQELRQAIRPMEQVISLMQVLYPVTVVLSLLVAAGVAALLTMMSAKEAAILRVLGNGKLRCRAILTLQVIVPCVVGLATGHLSAWLLAMTVPQSELLMIPAAVRLVLYLAAALAGTGISASMMTARNPLELLQVKE